MTAGDLRARVERRLDEDTSGGGRFYTAGEILGALNEGQRLFCLLTLCLERTGTLALSAGAAWYSMLAAFPAWLAPLRVRVAGSGGQKVRPATLQDLDALNPAWQAAEGTPSRYSQIGFDLLALSPHPADVGVSLDVTYAACPTEMLSDGYTPEIPEEDHPALIDYSISRLRTKEGGQEFAKSLLYFDRFIEVAKKRGDYVRARAKAQRYDVLPFELDRFDRSQLLQTAMKQ